MWLIDIIKQVMEILYNPNLPKVTPQKQNKKIGIANLNANP